MAAFRGWRNGWRRRSGACRRTRCAHRADRHRAWRGGCLAGARVTQDFGWEVCLGAWPGSAANRPQLSRQQINCRARQQVRFGLWRQVMSSEDCPSCAVRCSASRPPCNDHATAERFGLRSSAACAADERSRFGRRPGRGPARFGGQHLDVAETSRARTNPSRADAATARRFALPGLLRRFLQGPQGDGGGRAERCSRSARASSSMPSKGIIVTNNHVIADADEIEINFSDGSKLKAELVGTRHQDRYRRAEGRPR
jgi:S1-C subfamily serine protease